MVLRIIPGSVSADASTVCPRRRPNPSGCQYQCRGEMRGSPAGTIEPLDLLLGQKIVGDLVEQCCGLAGNQYSYRQRLPMVSPSINGISCRRKLVPWNFKPPLVAFSASLQVSALLVACGSGQEESACRAPGVPMIVAGGKTLRVVLVPHGHADLF